jgi:uncharacterized membrane protein
MLVSFRGMELDKLFGLPAHPLLVHVPVVLVPLAGLMAIAFALRAKWLDRFGWWLVAITGVGAAGAVLAAGSGEKLERRVGGSDALEKHAELGDTAKLVSVVFFLVVVSIMLFRWWSKKRAASGGKDIARTGAVAIITAVLLVAAGGSAGAAIAKAGHQGAKITWEEDAKKDVGGRGEGAPPSDTAYPPVTDGG